MTLYVFTYMLLIVFAAGITGRELVIDCRSTVNIECKNGQKLDIGDVKTKASNNSCSSDSLQQTQAYPKICTRKSETDCKQLDELCDGQTNCSFSANFWKQRVAINYNCVAGTKNRAAIIAVAVVSALLLAGMVGLLAYAILTFWNAEPHAAYMENTNVNRGSAPVDLPAIGPDREVVVEPLPASLPRGGVSLDNENKDPNSNV